VGEVVVLLADLAMDDPRVLGTISRVDETSVVVTLLEATPDGITEIAMSRASERVITTE
jgi:hypothetical protein